MVALEAMNRGVTVVASAVGGLADLIVDDRTGWLCAPDDPNALAERIIVGLQDQMLARRIAAQALQRVREEYSVERMVARTLAIYGHGAMRPIGRGL